MVRRKAGSGNPAGDETARSGIPRSIRLWVFVPIIGFTGVSMGFLVGIFYLLWSGAIQSEWAWAALILAFAGIPSAFVANVKKLMDAATSATS